MCTRRAQPYQQVRLLPVHRSASETEVIDIDSPVPKKLTQLTFANGEWVDVDPSWAGWMGETLPQSWCAYFLEAPGICQFKCLFALYFLSKYAVTMQTRLNAALEMEQAMVAEWGVGAFLKQLALEADAADGIVPWIPVHRKDYLPGGSRACTLFTFLFYYSRFGETVSSLLARFAQKRSHRIAG